MSSADATALLSRLAYEQAIAALARQQLVLDGLGSKAIGLLTANVVSTSLFGGWTLTTTGSFGPLSWCAAVCAAAAAMLAGAVIQPPRDLVLHPTVSADEVVVPETADKVYAITARYLRAAYRRNEAGLARFATKLRQCVVLMAVAALWWVANLAIGS